MLKVGIDYFEINLIRYSIQFHYSEIYNYENLLALCSHFPVGYGNNHTSGTA